MKYFILSFLVGIFAQAETVYQVSDQNAQKGYIEVGYDKSKGITIYYPDSYKAKLNVFSAQSMYVSEPMCSGYIKSKVEEIANISNPRERQARIASELFENNGSAISARIDYFPYVGDSFSNRVEKSLQAQGVRGQMHYRYPIPNVIASPVKLSFKSGALTSLISSVDRSEVLKQRNNRVSFVTVMATSYIPLACDILLNKVKYQIDWNISVMPFNGDYYAPLSENQVFTIYTALKDKQVLLPSLSTSSAAERAFIQGAIAGDFFKKEMGSLNAENVSVFKNLMQSFVFPSSFELRDLSSNDIENVYGSLMIDQTQPLELRGEAYVE